MPVIKRDQETFVAVLDAIMTLGSLTKACKAANIDPVTLSRWRRASEDGDDKFQEVDYRGLVQPLHSHVEDTIEQSVDEIESNFRASTRDGIWRAVLFQGQYQYEDDEHALSLSEKAFQDELELGLVWADKKRRVRNEVTGEWERVKVREWLPPSTEAQTIILRSWSDRYADKRSINFNGRLDVSQSVGVTVMPRTPMPPPPQLQIITPQLSDQVNEAVTDATFEDILGPEPEPAPEIEEDEPMPEQPEPPREPSPLTEEQRAILARARSGNSLAADLAAQAINRPAPKPAPARPFVPPPSSYDGDMPDDVPRSPRGVKVV
jgi:hypothetical protein